MKNALIDTGDNSNSKPIEGTPQGKPGYGLLHVASAEEVIKAQKKAEEEKAGAASAEALPQLTMLENYLSDIFEDAKRFKETETDIQTTMIDSLERKNSKYSPEKLASIKDADSSEVFLGITGIKCRAFEAFVHDVYMNAKRKRTWDLKPTPVVTLSDEDKARIKQKVLAESQALSPEEAYEQVSDMRAKIISAEYEDAKRKCENMSRKVHDQLIEGGFTTAMAEGLLDLSTMKAMVIKGPIVRKRKVRSGWKNGKVQYEQKEVLTFERVSPLDIYPSRYSKGVDGAPICQKGTIDRSSLVSNMDEDGYVKDAIKAIVMGHHKTSLVQANQESDREDAENKKSIAIGNPKPAYVGSDIPMVEHWCSCRGQDLISFGITKDDNGQDLNAMLDYEINAITVNKKIVFVEFNKHPLRKRPYSVTGFAKEIGGFWYKSIPELIKDPQDIINASSRALVNNLAIASGPQTVIPNINNLAPGEDITQAYPFKVWQGISSAAGQKLVEFYQPDSRSTELISIINEFIKICDNLIEMPSYSYGSDKVAGAGRTSSGLSMLMSSSNRGMKRVILDLDRNVFENTICQIVDYNLENSDDDSIKGDMNFYSEGVISMIMKEQLSERRLNFLNSTQNEFDMKILGLDGRAKILADAIESLESDYDDILPTDEKIDALIAQEEILQRQAIEEQQLKIQEMQATAEREANLQIQEAQLEMEKLEVEKRKQDLEFKAKERELDIRAQKQASDAMDKLMEQQEKGELPSAEA